MNSAEADLEEPRIDAFRHGAAPGHIPGSKFVMAQLRERAPREEA